MAIGTSTGETYEDGVDYLFGRAAGGGQTLGGPEKVKPTPAPGPIEDRLPEPPEGINYIEDRRNESFFHKFWQRLKSGFSNKFEGQPVFDNSHDVPFGAGASQKGDKIFIDKHIPRFDPNITDASGQPADMWAHVAVHEQTEHHLMTAYKMPYEKAHVEATKAEKAAVEAAGIDWKKYEGFWDRYLENTEKENEKDRPPGIYEKPYEHHHGTIMKEHSRIYGGKGGDNAALAVPPAEEETPSKYDMLKGAEEGMEIQDWLLEKFPENKDIIEQRNRNRELNQPKILEQDVSNKDKNVKVAGDAGSDNYKEAYQDLFNSPGRDTDPNWINKRTPLGQKLLEGNEEDAIPFPYRDYPYSGPKNESWIQKHGVLEADKALGALIEHLRGTLKNKRENEVDITTPTIKELEKYQADIRGRLRSENILSDEQPDVIKPGQKFAENETQENLRRRLQTIPYTPGNIHTSEESRNLLHRLDPQILPPSGAARAAKPSTPSIGKINLVRAKESALGNKLHQWHFIDDSGKDYGYINVVPEAGLDKKTLYVNYIHATRMDKSLENRFTGKEDLFPQGYMLQVLRSLKKLYPNMERVSGLRVSGAKGKAYSDWEEKYGIPTGLPFEEFQRRHEERHQKIRRGEIPEMPQTSQTIRLPELEE